jgi:hypothetical protein
MFNIKYEALVAGVLTLLCATVPLSGQQVASAEAPATFAPADTTASASQSQLVQRNPRYVIQRQDVLVLTFPLTPELNQTVTVQPDGYINLQNGGSLHVQGNTVPDVIDAVKKAYASTLHDPIVNVDLKDFQKPLFTVSGRAAQRNHRCRGHCGCGWPRAHSQDPGISVPQDAEWHLPRAAVQFERDP